MSRVPYLAGTVPPDVLLMKPVVAQVAPTELGGWLGRVNVQSNYTMLILRYRCNIVYSPLFWYDGSSESPRVLSSFG